MFQITIRWDRRGRLGARSFAVGAPPGETRGEVDDSLSSPPYQVQHAVVDTADGRLVTSPSSDLDRAEDVAGRLNAASLSP
jgi:hypothetical protein